MFIPKKKSKLQNKYFSSSTELLEKVKPKIEINEIIQQETEEPWWSAVGTDLADEVKIETAKNTTESELKIVEEKISKNAKIKLGKSNCFVFFEIGIKHRNKTDSIGKVTFELYTTLFPKTAENFRCLCTGEKGKTPSGIPLHYKGTSFHRIEPGFVVQVEPVLIVGRRHNSW